MPGACAGASCSASVGSMPRPCTGPAGAAARAAVPTASSAGGAGAPACAAPGWESAWALHGAGGGMGDGLLRQAAQ